MAVVNNVNPVQAAGYTANLTDLYQPRTRSRSAGLGNVQDLYTGDNGRNAERLPGQPAANISEAVRRTSPDTAYAQSQIQRIRTEVQAATIPELNARSFEQNRSIRRQFAPEDRQSITGASDTPANDAPSVRDRERVIDRTYGGGRVNRDSLSTPSTTESFLTTVLRDRVPGKTESVANRTGRPGAGGIPEARNSVESPRTGTRIQIAVRETSGENQGTAAVGRNLDIKI